MKITNLVLWVQDATLSYKFYKKLGFEVGEVNDRHALVRCGDFEIQLITMRNEDEFNKDSLASQKGLGMYIRINVENVDDMYAHVQKLGLSTSSEPRDWEWGAREFVLKDPDGYKICFWSAL
jgi:catechol 2,3-dioxygenase-like lactoylglutathione lyase family enzyme